jgi:hypothetical protein
MQVGTMKQRMSSLGWMGALLSVAGGASAFACSGEEFCAESRTCPPVDEDSAAGHAGQAVDAAGGTSHSTGGVDQGGHDSTSVGANGGAGGEPPSTVGNACTTDAECDDKSSCTGVEKCVDGACAAGEAVQCPAGLDCSDAKNSACVFKTDAPWILYTVDAETKGINELYGLKSDLVGTMLPVKLSPALAAGWVVADNFPVWSADGTTAVVNTTNKQLKKVDSYLLRFTDRLPEKPILLTEGMSASTVSTAQWSASGKSLLLQRDDGVHWLQVAEDGKVSQELASGTGYTASPAWIKNDTAVVFFGKNIVSSKSGFYLAERGAASWSQKLIAELPSVTSASLTADGSLLGYLVVDMVSYAQTLSVVETTAGAKPAKLAGPATNTSFNAAPDTTQFLLGVTNGATGKTNLSGGGRADLFALPVLKAGLSLGVGDISPLFPHTPWAYDSSAAWAFQDDPIGKQLVLFQPKADEKWHPLPLKQMKTDPFPVWSPDSSVLALPSKTAADSPIDLSLVSTITYESRNLDQTVNGGFIKMFGFSSGSELFAYAKGTGGPATNGYYIDLRKGLAKAPAPLPIQDPIESLQFATRGTGALYARAGKTDCFYVDLASATPDTALAVYEGKPVASCFFQKLPK